MSTETLQSLTIILVGILCILNSITLHHLTRGM